MSTKERFPAFVAMEAAADELESELGGAERAADVNQIAGPRSGAGEGSAASDFADDRDTDGDRWLARGIAASEKQVVLPRGA